MPERSAPAQFAWRERLWDFKVASVSLECAEGSFVEIRYLTPAEHPPPRIAQVAVGVGCTEKKRRPQDATRDPAENSHRSEQRLDRGEVGDGTSRLGKQGSLGGEGRQFHDSQTPRPRIYVNP